MRFTSFEVWCALLDKLLQGGPREVALSNHGVFFVVVWLLRLCFVFGTDRRDRNKTLQFKDFKFFDMLP